MIGIHAMTSTSYYFYDSENIWYINQYFIFSRTAPVCKENLTRIHACRELSFISWSWNESQLNKKKKKIKDNQNKIVTEKAAQKHNPQIHNQAYQNQWFIDPNCSTDDKTNLIFIFPFNTMWKNAFLIKEQTIIRPIIQYLIQK